MENDEVRQEVAGRKAIGPRDLQQGAEVADDKSDDLKVLKESVDDTADVLRGPEDNYEGREDWAKYLNRFGHLQSQAYNDPWKQP